MITSYVSLRLYLAVGGRSSRLRKSIEICFSHIKKASIIRISRSFPQCFILFIDSPVAGSIFGTKALLSLVSWYNVLFYNIGSSLYMQSKCIWMGSELLGEKKVFCHFLSWTAPFELEGSKGSEGGSGLDTPSV